MRRIVKRIEINKLVENKESTNRYERDFYTCLEITSRYFCRCLVLRGKERYLQLGLLCGGARETKETDTRRVCLH